MLVKNAEALERLEKVTTLVVDKTGKGIIKGGSEVGADVGKTAVAAVEGAVKAAGAVGADTAKALEHATTGAIEAADEIGSDQHLPQTHAYHEQRSDLNIEGSTEEDPTNDLICTAS